MSVNDFPRESNFAQLKRRIGLRHTRLRAEMVVRSVVRLAKTAALFFAAVILISPSAPGAAPPGKSLTLTAPYLGHAYHFVNFMPTTTKCVQNHFFVPPRFNKTTGLASTVQESKVSGA